MHGLHVVPDAYPLAVKIRINATFGYIEDLNEENEEEDQPFDDKELVGVVTEALADKEREIQMYLAYHRDSDAQQVGDECYQVQSEKISKRTTRLVGDDHRTGKNMRRRTCWRISQKSLSSRRHTTGQRGAHGDHLSW